MESLPSTYCIDIHAKADEDSFLTHPSRAKNRLGFHRRMCC